MRSNPPVQDFGYGVVGGKEIAVRLNGLHGNVHKFGSLFGPIEPQASTGKMHDVVIRRAGVFVQLRCVLQCFLSVIQMANG
jgi:hypothetical protein